MKKTYIIPNERVVDLRLEGQLLSDSAIGTGGYDGSQNPSGEGDGMDEDNSVKAQRFGDTEW